MSSNNMVLICWHRWVRDDNGFIKCDNSTDSRPECVKSGGQNVPFLEFIWGDVARSIYTFKPSDIYNVTVEDQVRSQ